LALGALSLAGCAGSPAPGAQAPSGIGADCVTAWNLMSSPTLAQRLPANFNPTLLFECQWQESAGNGQGIVVIRGAKGSITGLVDALRRPDRTRFPSRAACGPGGTGPFEVYFVKDASGRLFFPRLPAAGVCSTQLPSPAAVDHADFVRLATVPVAKRDGTLVLVHS
jgi:hypothetical protein